MMTLITNSSLIDTNTVQVLWSKGIKTRGVLNVNISNINTDDNVLVAELAAIRHLLFNKNIFDREIIDGSGMCLKVSRGAIKKLTQSRSSKRDMFSYAAFLRIRMSKAKIVVNKSSEFLPGPDAYEPERITITDESFKQMHERVTTPAMGDFFVTVHAIEQYVNRIKTGTPDRPWKSLLKRLSHPSLRKMPIPPAVLRHKEKKYGDNNIEVWGHDSSEFMFLIVVGKNRRTLVSAFERQIGY